MEASRGVDPDICPQAVTPNTTNTITERMDASSFLQ
jgi:hypothetical protein